MNAAARIGVLLINLGTPQQPTAKAVRRYLAEFLSDRRVVELPSWLWQPLLKMLILPIRSRQSAKLYRSIWLEEGSPLAVYSQRLAQKIQQNLGVRFKVCLAMRYGPPSIASALQTLQADANITSIVILPLYPQYAAATTASCFDVIADFFKQQRVIPTLHFIHAYFTHPAYLNALTAHLQQEMKQHNDYLLFSFHGLPQRSVDLGDPYEQQCYATAHQLAKNLSLATHQYQVVFQSRFGRTQWLQPYCETVLAELPKRGIRRVTVTCPGFAVDCLETLEEIAKRYREIFLQAGGEAFYYIPALNDDDRHSAGLATLIQELINARNLEWNQ
jgi:protoporphyrin/coproporphyrin ferrochelatase